MSLNSTLQTFAGFFLAVCMLAAGSRTGIAGTQPVFRNSGALIQTLSRQNQLLAADRRHIEDIAAHYLQNDDISETDFNWLKNIAADYNMAPRQRGDQTFFQDLLLRVDIIPASLAVAQAMLESGAAGNTRQSNNPFGIECRQDCSPPHSLMSFASQQAAVAYYTRLLNTGAAYQRFRELRAQLRSKNRQLRAEQLAAGLSVYAGRAKGYIQKIRTTITTHQLAKLDQA